MKRRHKENPPPDITEAQGSGLLGGRLDAHMRELVRGAGVALFLKVSGAGLAFGFNIALARILGAHGAGLYFLGLTTITVASVIGRAGLDNALLRFTAGSAAVDDWSAVRGVYQKGIGIGGGISLAAALAVFLGAPWISEAIFSEPTLTDPLRVMALAVVPFSLLILHAELLKGLKRIFESQLVQGIGIPALSLAGVLVLAPTFGVMGAAWAYVAATILTTVLGLWLWRRGTLEFRTARPRFETGVLLASAAPLFWVALLNLVMNWASSGLLGVWADAREVGIFNVAHRTALLTGFVLFAVNAIAAPKFSGLYAAGDITALDSTARRSAALMAIAALPILLVLVFFPGPVLSLFGPEFRAGSTVLIVLAAGQFVNVVTGSVSYLLMMSGRERLLRNLMFGAALLNLILNALLIPRIGMLGAAVATTGSLVFLNVAAAVLVYRRLSIVILPIPGALRAAMRGPC